MGDGPLSKRVDRIVLLAVLGCTRLISCRRCSALCATAQDAVKFLTTLERHFKNLEHAPLPAVTEMLPSMVSAIQMVWVISRT